LVGRAPALDRSDIVATLNDLLADGFVRRKPDEADRRRNIVVITPRGRRLLERLDARVDEVQSALLAPLGEQERATLVRLLGKLS
jgi:DNA-binding MarR family transcriptional regulator